MDDQQPSSSSNAGVASSQSSSSNRPFNPRRNYFLNDRRRGGQTVLNNNNNRRSETNNGRTAESGGQLNEHSRRHQNNRNPRRGSYRVNRGQEYAQVNNRSTENWRQPSNEVVSGQVNNGVTEPVPSTSSSNNINRGNGNTRNAVVNSVQFRKTLKARLEIEEKTDPDSQRRKLEDALKNSSLECMVCCEDIKVTDQVWSCFSSCHNVFHLHCISTWACSVIQEQQTSQVASSRQPSSEWRCPACQSLYQKFPSRYYCFCGKKRNPEVSKTTPHSCGSLCNRRRGVRCPHKCPLNCHPGPCPSCDVGVSVSCLCGKQTIATSCGSAATTVSCNTRCDALLGCGRHSCPLICHPQGTCPPCLQTLEALCFCGKSSKQLECKDTPSNESLEFSCPSVCNKKLDCGKHSCQIRCHSGSCDPCKLSPRIAKTCNCGKKALTDFTGKNAKLRKSCSDPLPSCGQVCGKTISKCGHECSRKCHTGSCEPCPLSTKLTCRCGASSQVFPCPDTPEVFICPRTCPKKLSCGRHKCSNSCCPRNTDHVCNKTCDKKLSCGQHKCPDSCGHTGGCLACWNVSWNELSCHCGSEVLLPPVSCGAKVPVCSKPCTRRRDCDHPADHTCHPEDECPPCTASVIKNCWGGHTLMTRVACCASGASCGRVCDKPLPCQNHRCQRICHEPDRQGTCGSCNYPCGKLMSCGHRCSSNCHSDKDCNEKACKVVVDATCRCKRRQEKKQCWQMTSIKVTPINLMNKLRITDDEEVDIKELMKKEEEDKFSRLECDANCSLSERNRNLAEALGISNPVTVPVNQIKYPESLKQAFMHYPDFVKETYLELEDIVNQLEKSRNNSSVRNFPAMRGDLRQVVHELAEMFNMKSHSVDPEPSRSVVVKGVKGRAKVPANSIMEVMKDKVLTFKKPVVTEKKGNFATKNDTKRKVIDYFDFDGQD